MSENAEVAKYEDKQDAKCCYCENNLFATNYTKSITLVSVCLSLEKPRFSWDIGICLPGRNAKQQDFGQYTGV